MENKAVTTKDFFSKDSVVNKFKELLGNKSAGFITGVLQVVNQNKLLQTTDPKSIYQAAAMAAILDLPINNNLGMAWVVPYKGNAQFQIGWKGFVQLAQRSGQYLRINVTEVYENQYKYFNQLTEEFDADFNLEGTGKIVGYVGYIKLINGFEKTTYWSKTKVENHAKKYSQAYKNEKSMSPWRDSEQFHEMAKKTVIKNLLSKWGPLSIEMVKAQTVDQAVINDFETEDITYVDHEPNQLEPESTSHSDLKQLYEDKKDTLTEEQRESAERIINGFEVHSYGKLTNILKSK